MTLTTDLSVTPAGGGANNSGSFVAPDLPCDSQGADQAVAAPPVPDEMPGPAGADVTLDEVFEFDLTALEAEDDSDPQAFPRSRRLICSVSSDGQTTIHRMGSVGIVLTAEETLEAYEFLAHTARIWSAAT